MGLAMRKVQEIYNADPDAYFYPNQYDNPANWQAHFNSTGPEIIEQTGGRIHPFHHTPSELAGTFMGTTRRLRQELPHVECISGQPSAGFHGLEGLKYMPTAIVPKIYDEKLADRNVWLETDDAHAMVKRLARDEGILVGISAGANVHAALTLGKQLHAQGREARDRHDLLRQRRSSHLSEHFWGRINDRH